MKQLEGKVVSNKMAKTVVVEVVRQVKNHLYGKILKKTKKYKARYENLSLNIGDRVKIATSRPIAKEVHYKVITKI